MSVPAQPGDATPPERAARRRLIDEIWIVLGVSLAAAALYAVIDLVGKLTAGPPLAAQTATVNRSVTPRPYLDLSYQLAGIAVTLVPVVLVVWLLSQPAGDLVRSGARRIGLDGAAPGRDLLHGAGLAAVIGIPGLAFYLVGRELGITVSVVASALNAHWWTVPVLILQAVKNAALEEVIVVGYLLTRLQRIGWPTWAAFCASAVLRASVSIRSASWCTGGAVLEAMTIRVTARTNWRRSKRCMRKWLPPRVRCPMSSSRSSKEAIMRVLEGEGR